MNPFFTLRRHSRLLKGELISTPVPSVDLYCAVAAKHLAPMGGYDLDHFPEQQVTLRFAQPEDLFTPLSGRRADFPLSPDIVIYASGNEVICWSFNHRDSRITCLQRQTRSTVFFGEGVAAVHRAPLKTALEELRDLLQSAGAKVGEVCFVDQEIPRAVLRPHEG